MGRSAMGAADVFASIRRIEAKADLDDSDWLVEDMHLWPLYRMELYRAMFAHQLEQGRTGSSPEGLASRLRPSMSSIRGASAPQAGAIWLVSDGISFTRTGAHEMEKFCGPLWHACKSLGRAVLILDRGSLSPRHSLEPVEWETPRTARAKLIGLAGAALRPDARHGRLVKRLHAIGRELQIDLPALSSRRFDAMTRAVLRLARAHVRRMIRDKPLAVMLVCWYDVGGYAYVLAGARAGIPVMDVQHGVTGQFHAAYSGWRDLPATVFRLIPTHFWTWTAADAAVIDAWGSVAGRRAVCGGHPLMQAWAAGLVPLGDAMNERLSQMLTDAQGRVRVLVTLQPGLLTPESLRPFIEACSSATNVAWWLRLHPMARSDAPSVEELMQGLKVEHWNVSDASDLPLPAVLAVSDVHATHSSSAVIEAEVLDVPSVVWSAYGRDLFEATVAPRLLKVTLTGESLVQALGPRPANVARSPMGEAVESMPQLHEALATFLGSLQ